MLATPSCKLLIALPTPFIALSLALVAPLFATSLSLPSCATRPRSPNVFPVALRPSLAEAIVFSAASLVLIAAILPTDLMAVSAFSILVFSLTKSFDSKALRRSSLFVGSFSAFKAFLASEKESLESGA